MSLDWESTYAIALALQRAHPEAKLANVTLEDVFVWTMALPEFSDDAALCNDEILQSIFQEWYEVTINA